MIARSKLQLDEADGLDRKGTTTLVTSGVLLGLAVTNVEDFIDVAGWSPALFNLALVTFAAGLVLGMLELWPRAFNVVPRPKDFLARTYAKTAEETTAKLLATNLLAFERNEGMARVKGWLLRIQMALVTVGGSLLVGAYLLKELLTCRIKSPAGATCRKTIKIPSP